MGMFDVSPEQEELLHKRAFKEIVEKSIGEENGLAKALMSILRDGVYAEQRVKDLEAQLITIATANPVEWFADKGEGVNPYYEYYKWACGRARDAVVYKHITVRNQESKEARVKELEFYLRKIATGTEWMRKPDAVHSEDAFFNWATDLALEALRGKEQLPEGEKNK